MTENAKHKRDGFRSFKHILKNLKNRGGIGIRPLTLKMYQMVSLFYCPYVTSVRDLALR